MEGFDRINAVLPDELIDEIFRPLDSNQNREACSLVCKRWLSLERLSRDTIRIGASSRSSTLVEFLARRFVNFRNVLIDGYILNSPLLLFVRISLHFCVSFFLFWESWYLGNLI
ncbi:F-box/LRR-repeat protein 4 [Abeliophyllum distichum]|uniref:F-box/LRR-repeat protein 4 n=1 Tax=Abeliophyllum distichum TaxID=126358 RepID=A0ABD1T202_9LAMI